VHYSLAAVERRGLRWALAVQQAEEEVIMASRSEDEVSF
jgi:hypothetical protein